MEMDTEKLMQLSHFAYEHVLGLIRPDILIRMWFYTRVNMKNENAKSKLVVIFSSTNVPAIGARTNL